MRCSFVWSQGVGRWLLQTEIPLQRVSDTLLLNELYRYYAVYRYASPPAPAACRTANQQGQ